MTDAVNIGPFAVPAEPLVLLLSVVTATFIGKRLSGQNEIAVEYALWKALLIGVLTSRLAYVAMHLDEYRQAPWSMVDIRDGGFMGWTGALVALLTAAWLGWRRTELRKPLTVSILVGGFMWTTFNTVPMFLEVDTVQMPQVALQRLDGGEQKMTSFIGKPTVVNLWATWCPPCRREMPVLRDAQRTNSNIHFVFANQGEPPEVVKKYLAAEGLDLSNVLLDSSMQVAKETRSKGLPTTLFFDANGNLVDRRTGELSHATLKERIDVLVDNYGQ